MNSLRVTAAWLNGSYRSQVDSVNRSARGRSDKCVEWSKGLGTEYCAIYKNIPCLCLMTAPRLGVAGALGYQDSPSPSPSPALGGAIPSAQIAAKQGEMAGWVTLFPDVNICI